MRQTSHSRLLVALFAFLAWIASLANFAFANSASAPGQSDVLAARRVLAGSERTQAVLKSCEARYRSAGIDPRYMESFWKKGRFEIFEGVRIVLGHEPIGTKDPVSIGSATAIRSDSPEQCDSLVRDDSAAGRTIQGVAQSDLQRMKDIYAASHPDPHVRRDNSLHNDCMKANFNARQLNFDTARRRCDCTLKAMQTIPASDLDAWLAQAQAGADVPMPKQPWFPALLPKLLVCNSSS